LPRDQRFSAKIVDPCPGITGPRRGISEFRPKSLVLAEGTLIPAAGAPFLGQDRPSLRGEPWSRVLVGHSLFIAASPLAASVSFDA